MCLLEWQSLEQCKAQAWVTMLYKIANNIVNINPSLYLQPAIVRGEDAMQFIIPGSRVSAFQYSSSLELPDCSIGSAVTWLSCQSRLATAVWQTSSFTKQPHVFLDYTYQVFTPSCAQSYDYSAHHWFLCLHQHHKQRHEITFTWGVKCWARTPHIPFSWILRS